MMYKGQKKTHGEDGRFLDVYELLGGSGALRSRDLSRVANVTTLFRVLRTLLISTHEPSSGFRALEA